MPVLKASGKVLGLLGSLCFYLDEVTENLKTQEVVLGVGLLVSETGSVLKNHDLFVFNFLFEAVDANRIEQPVPSKFGNYAAVAICVKVLFAVEVEPQRFLPDLLGGRPDLCRLDVYLGNFAGAGFYFKRVTSFD